MSSTGRGTSRDRAATRRAGTLAPVGWVVLAGGTAVVAAVLAGALRSSTLPTLLGTGLARAGADVAGTACVGLALVGVLVSAVGRGGEAVAVRTVVDRALVGAGAAWVVVALLGIGFRAADAYGRPLTTLTGPEVLAFATRLTAGRGALLTAACAAAVLGCAVVRRRGAAPRQGRDGAAPRQGRDGTDVVALRVVLVVALLGMLTPGVTGHASTAAGHEVAVTTVALHAAAASLWGGGLGAILVVLRRRRALLEAVLPRFSTLAGACLALVAVSGVLTAAVRLGSWAALLHTGYGALVLAKAVALALLGGLGLLTRRRMAAGRGPVLRWAGVEIGVMAVALGLAAALSHAA